MDYQGRYGVPGSIPQQPTEADADLWDAAARRAAGENDWEAARDLFAEAGKIAEKLGDISALILAHVHVQQCIRDGEETSASVGDGLTRALDSPIRLGVNRTRT